MLIGKIKNLGLKAIHLGLLAVAIVGLGGCTTGPNEAGSDETTEASKPLNSDRIQIGDPLKIAFRGPTQLIPDHEERVANDGFITLPQIGEVKAAGLTRSELQKIIHEKYVPDYYKTLTVTVAPLERFFYVRGYVKMPNRYVYNGELTVLGAIATAGGFAMFAKETDVQLTRTNGKVETINCKKASDDPSLDLKVLPGDQIYVPIKHF